MELIGIARVLWRRRVLVVLGAPCFIALALLGAHRVSVSPFSLTPPSHTVGAASVKVLVDTPQSQLVDLRHTPAYDPTILPTRVQILADELAGDSARESIARDASLPAGQITISPFASGPTRTTALARRLAELDMAGGRPYVIRLSADPYMPIVTIVTKAPTAEEADRLAEGAITTFARLVELDGADRGFVATPLGSPLTGQFLQGSGKALTAALGLFAVCVWLFVVVIADGIAAAWRRSLPVRVVDA